MPPPAEPLVPESASATSLPEVRGGSRAYLDATVAMLAETFKADRAALYLYDEESNSIAMRAAFGFPMFGKAAVVVKLGEGLTGRALAERRPIYTEMASSMRGYVSHPNFPDADVQTFLGIPLLRGRERIGVVALYRRTGHPFLAEEISAARLKVSAMADAIQNAGALLLAEHGAAAAAAMA
ncbi:MAG: GAF domain-containing protein, partial [Kiritimatiellae bacterium]|nr:GAF domain-containing protein [Kiritimatiellia bacterium]